MFVIHQIVGVLSDPVFAGLFALAIGLALVRRRWGRLILALDFRAADTRRASADSSTSGSERADMARAGRGSGAAARTPPLAADR